MDGIGPTTSVERHVQPAIILARASLFCCAIIAIILSAALLLRGMNDRFAPLQTSALLSAVVCFVLCADLWRCAIRRTGLAPRWGLWMSDAAATVVLVFLTSAVSVNGTLALDLTVVWSSLILHEIIVYVVPRLGALRRFAVSSLRSTTSKGLSPSTAPTVTQRLLRWSEDEEDVVLAEFHCTFEPHERQQPIHIVFCPPLLRSPSITSERLSGPQVTLKTSQCYTFGARLDVRLASASVSATDVVVRVVARAPNT
jgi:hypothetical protein